MPAIPGRSGITKLFDDGVIWPRPGGHPLPIVWLTGPAGSGKTFLLRALRAEAEDLPSAYVDIEHRNVSSPFDIMVELANQLGIGHRGLGRIRFPRFWLGLLVTELEFEGQTTDAQRQTVNALLRQIRSFHPIPQHIKEMVVRLASLTGVSNETSTHAAVATIEAALRSRGGPAHGWWGRRGRQSATDALLRFRYAFDSRDPIDRRDVEEVLCRALLADVRAAYSNRFRGPDRTVSCACLIDNVHTGGGNEFVELLARIRAEPGTAPDPLFVLVAGTQPLPMPALPDDVRLAAWSEAHDQEDWRTWLCPIVLRDLDRDEVDRLARTRGLRSRGALATFAHRMTGGHPGGVRTVLDMVERGRVDLPDAVLNTGLLDELLGEMPAEHRDALVSCAAARHVNLPVMLAALGRAPHLGGLDDARADDARGTATALLGSLGTLLWLRGDGPDAELHPWLRRLLLTALAARADDHPDSWHVVHRRVRDHHDAEGDLIGGRYHRLAVDDVEHVVRVLDADRRIVDQPDRWAADLLAVVAAPSRHPAVDPADRVRELVSWSATESRRVRAIAGVVATHLVVADPLSDPFGRLVSALADRWDVLSSEIPAASAVFFTMAQRMRAEHGTGNHVFEDLSFWRGRGPEVGNRQPRRITAPTSSRRKVLRVLTLAGVAAGAAAAGVPFVVGRDRCGDDITRMGEVGECIGVTDGSYVFSGELSTVLGLIGAENNRLGPGRDTTTIGIALPMPHDGHGVMTTAQVRHELEGAYIAQYIANNHGAETPKIRLEIANVGHLAAHWGPVVERFARTRELRVVAGLGPSVRATKEAVRALNRRRIATIASVMTADDLHGGEKGVPSFARVAPTNRDEVDAALRAGMLTDRTVLVKDSNADDHYTRTLAEQFIAQRPKALSEHYDSSSDGVANRLRDIASWLCDNERDRVYFAGRSEHLLQFVIKLDDGLCRERPFTVVTGDDASVLVLDHEDPVHQRFSEALKKGQVTVLCTALAHPAQWNDSDMRWAETFDTFAREYGRRFDTGELDDGQAMMAFDCVTTAAHAVRRGTGGNNMWAGIKGPLMVDGVTGPIELGEEGNPVGKPVPLLRIKHDGTKTFKTLSWTKR